MASDRIKRESLINNRSMSVAGFLARGAGWRTRPSELVQGNHRGVFKRSRSVFAR
jgi:hypothetical protein